MLKISNIGIMVSPKVGLTQTMCSEELQDKLASSGPLQVGLRRSCMECMSLLRISSSFYTRHMY